MSDELIKECIQMIDTSIGGLIVTIAEQEKKRAQMLSMLAKEERKSIKSAEKSYYIAGPPKVLYLEIPALPVSFNRATRSCFARGKNVVNNLFEWWNLKIENALNNMMLLDGDRELTVFSQATVIVMFRFTKTVLRDIDNYAVKAINDALIKNSVLLDDSSDNVRALLPLMKLKEPNEPCGVEIYVTEDTSTEELVKYIYEKHKSLFRNVDKAEQTPPKKGDFFTVF